MPNGGDCTEGYYMATPHRDYEFGGCVVYIRHSFEQEPFIDTDHRQVNSPLLSRAWLHQKDLLQSSFIFSLSFPCFPCLLS